MRDKMTRDAITAVAAILRLDDTAETGPPPPALVTPDCVPFARWKERSTALAAGRPWAWLEPEARHIPTCDFCRRLDRLIPPVSGDPTASDQSLPNPCRPDDTVSVTGVDQGTMPTGRPDRPGDWADMLLGPAVNDVVTRAVAGSPTTLPADLTLVVEAALAHIWPLAALPATHRRILWKYAANAASGGDRPTAIVLLADGGGFTDQEIAEALNVPVYEVVRDRIFAR